MCRRLHRAEHAISNHQHRGGLRALERFADHPALVRAIGVAGLAAGMWLATRQYRRSRGGAASDALESPAA